MERFLVEGYGLTWMTWEHAEQWPVRIKTSLALTRARARMAMELSLRKPDMTDLYMRGLVRFFA